MGQSRRINVRGTVTAITYPATGEEPRVDVMMTVGEDDRLLLRFLGRTTVRCLDIGSRLRIKGTLSMAGGTLMVLNPAITVLSEDA